MAKKGEIFWEVGKELPKESWDKVWSRGECVESPKFTMPDVCTLQIFFYPGGIGDSEVPMFKLVRSNTTMKLRKIQGEIQLLHKDFLAGRFYLDDQFERGCTDYVHGFRDFPDLHTLKIVNTLPELGYRWIYRVLDPDPNETEPEREPEPEPERVPELDIIMNGIEFVWSGISYVFGMNK